MSLSAAAGAGKALGLSLAACAGLNLVGFGITAATQTHKITDITGTSAFVASSVATYAFAARGLGLGACRPVALGLTVCTSVWALRLGSYLGGRIR